MSEAERPSHDERPAVDGSLIEDMLRLTPLERLRQNDRAAALAASLQAAFSRQGEAWQKPAR
jgi:hypothetical protein